MYCKSTSVADHEAAEKYVATKLTKSFICEVCGVGCSSKGTLQVHKRSHDTSWVPKQCDVIGCKSKTYWKNEDSWKTHQVGSHGSFTPLHCPVQDCKDALNKKLFSSRDSFKLHLGRHGIKGKDATDYLPKRIGENE